MIVSQHSKTTSNSQNCQIIDLIFLFEKLHSILTLKNSELTPKRLGSAVSLVVRNISKIPLGYSTFRTLTCPQTRRQALLHSTLLTAVMKTLHHTGYHLSSSLLHFVTPCVSPSSYSWEEYKPTTMPLHSCGSDKEHWLLTQQRVSRDCFTCSSSL